MANEIAAVPPQPRRPPAPRAAASPVVDDALDRLLLPSLEREIRRELTERAQDHAVVRVRPNLRSLLLQPPLRGKRVLAVDPGIPHRLQARGARRDRASCSKTRSSTRTGRRSRTRPTRSGSSKQLVRKHQIVGHRHRQRHRLPRDGAAGRRPDRRPRAPAAEPDARPCSRPPPTTPTGAGRPRPRRPPPEPAAADAAAAAIDARRRRGAAARRADASRSSSGDAVASELPPRRPRRTTVTARGRRRPRRPAPPPRRPRSPPRPAAAAAAPADPPRRAARRAGRPRLRDRQRGRGERLLGQPGRPRGVPAPRRHHCAAPSRIGRRLQDPLGELVKIDPQHVGVGLYQHDVKPKHLKESLEAVIESCVNHGRRGPEHGQRAAAAARVRAEPAGRPRAGRVPQAERPVHAPASSCCRCRASARSGSRRRPGSSRSATATTRSTPPGSTPRATRVARQLLDRPRLRPGRPARPGEARGAARASSTALTAGGGGGPAAGRRADASRDILDALARPGRDPREDLPPPIFKKGVLKLEDLTAGHGAEGHGAERRRLRGVRGHRAEGQRPGPHQPDGQPLHQEPVRRGGGRRRGDGVGDGGEAGARRRSR